MGTINKMAKSFDNTRGKTTAATIGWLLLRVINNIWPDSISPETQLILYDSIEVLAVMGIGHKLWRGKDKLINKFKSMNRKGVFLPEHEVFMATVVWSFVEPSKPKWLPKGVSMVGVNMVIRTIDNVILHRLPEKIKAIIRPFMDAAFKGNIQEMRRLATDVFASLVDWKGVSKNRQLSLYDSSTRFIVDLTMAFVEKRQAQKEAIEFPS